MNIPLASCRACCLGMAGLGRPADREIIQRICHQLGFPRNIVLTHDAHIALVGSALKALGVIIIAGIGSIIYGINESGAEYRTGGWGYILDDEGSGYDIARRALQAVVRAHDGRGPTTLLKDSILGQLNFSQPEQLVQWVHAASRTDIATLAPIVFATAAERDATAEAIIAYAVDELTLGAQIVLDKLYLRNTTCDIVLSGGLFEHHPSFVEQVFARLPDFAPRAHPTLPQKEPAYGAVLLALLE
ncbi:MAG: ATPase [Deltaproteobacteria bacterium]|nr:ATPase [Deltaproteobacteria bacterium]